MTPVLSFDIETVPDVAGLRILHGFDASLPDAEVAEFASQKQRARNGSDFLQHHLHRVVAISCVLRWSDRIIVKTIGSPEDSERDMIATFFDTLARYTPQLVSWNGGGFDLPVLHYRAMRHGISAPRYWDTGDGDHADSRDFKWNNYISRYHQRHLDLMDMLALYQPRASVPLDDMARLCGFPGKLGMDGSRVWEAFMDGRIEAIRNYCETDAANTYLLYLRFQLMRGALDETGYAHEIALLKDWVGAREDAHWREFATAWDTAAGTA